MLFELSSQITATNELFTILKSLHQFIPLSKTQNKIWFVFQSHFHMKFGMFCFSFSHSAKALHWYWITLQSFFLLELHLHFPSLFVSFISPPISCISVFFMNEKNKHFNAWISIGTITIDWTLNSFSKKITFEVFDWCYSTTVCFIDKLQN